MQTDDYVQLAELAVIAGAIVLLARAAPDIPQAIANAVQSGVTRMGAGFDAAQNVARIESALSAVSRFPDWMEIPLTGQMAGDLYTVGYTTDEMKDLIRDYVRNYAASAIEQDRLLYQLGSFIGYVPDYSMVTP